MARQYLPFVDWLKTIGLALIVYGHVAARTSPYAMPPVYQKQLGVAFFVFAMGFTLAREQRPRWRVVYNRLFEVWTMGLLFAVLLSVIGLVFWHDANESNYLPLTGLTTIYMNDFPANPTTWYIGTYIHLLMIWSLVLRQVRITVTRLFGLAIFEIVARVGPLAILGRYSAYMFVANWITLLAVGMWMGQQGTASAVPARTMPAIVLLAVAIGWPVAARGVPWQLGFPFMDVAAGTWTGLFVVSVCASAVYLAYTLATYAFVRTLPAHAFSRFFARNTVVVFIVHMPVYYLLEWMLRPITSFGVRASLEFLICFVALALVSEAFRRLLRPDVWRERLGTYLAPILDGTAGSPRIKITESVSSP